MPTYNSRCCKYVFTLGLGCPKYFYMYRGSMFELGCGGACGRVLGAWPCGGKLVFGSLGGPGCTVATRAWLEGWLPRGTEGRVAHSTYK